LIGGALALPATLLGLLVAARRRRVTTAGANLAAHPLETPLGLLTVLCVAAALGAGLAMIH
jgi:hypothetical protein